MNATRLDIALMRRGLTKAVLLKALNIDAKTLRAYVSGSIQPHPAFVAEVAYRLKFPVAFFEGDDLSIPSKDNVSFRSMKTMSAAKRKMALSQGGLALYVNSWLQKRFELPAPDLQDFRYESNPEAAAETLRQMWGLGQLSVRNMIHLLEARGVRVFSLSVGSKEVDAFSMWQDGQPFVFLNTWKSAEHSRMDAAHELGHLVMHRHGPIRGREPESDAHAFGAAFLMPRSSVKAYASPFPTLDELMRLKKIWGVSVTALNFRLHKIGMTSDWHYKTLCIEIAQRGYRTFEPEGMPRETSLVLPQLLASLYEDNGLTRSQIADELGLPVAEFEQLFFGLVLTGVNGKRKGEAPALRTTELKRVK